MFKVNFTMFSKEVNVYGGGNCLEFSYIKLHPDFWGSEFKANMRDGRLPSPAVLLAARAARKGRQQTEPRISIYWGRVSRSDVDCQLLLPTTSTTTSSYY
jgi:hypothetical protein